MKTVKNLSEQSAPQLLTTLRQLMTTTHRYKSTYNDCRDRAALTDSVDESGNISLLYTSVLVTRLDFGGDDGTWNREHVWPKSLGGFKNDGAGADLHHIRSSDATVNARRDNLKYGNVENGNPVTGSALVGGMVSGYSRGDYFEPLDNAKGDVARICLYVYARYGGELSMCSSITNVFQSVDVLLEWCELDPVDEWEMSRNDVVEGIQGNRNVFIDYPEYAWLLFGKEIPDDMATPSGEAAKKDIAADGPTDPDTPFLPDDMIPEDECTHEFAPWQYTDSGEKRRACIHCGKMEFAPIEDGAPMTEIVVTVAVAAVAVVAAGIIVYVCVRRSRIKKSSNYIKDPRGPYGFLGDF